MTVQDNNCPLCGRGNCRSQSRPKKKAQLINRLALIVTENTLRALQTVAGHSVTELEHDYEKRDLFLDYVRKACDAMHEVDRTDCRLISSIFGGQQRGKYYGREAGQTRNRLSHVLMQEPDLSTIYQGVVVHFPIWHRVFCEMFCEASPQEDWKIQGATHYAGRYQRRMESLLGMPQEFESIEPKWENLAFQKAINETAGPAWSIEEAKQYPMADRVAHGGFRLVEFSENGEPTCSEITPHWGDSTRMSRICGGLYGRIVSHNPLWAWESEMDGMYSCEFSPGEMHPKSLCLWQRWNSPQGEFHAKQIEAEMAYIRAYEAYVQPYSNKLRSQQMEEAEQSKYDVLLIHLSPDSPAPVRVHTLPANQDIPPEERFRNLSALTVNRLRYEAGIDPRMEFHGTVYLHECELLKRNAFVAHVTPAGSRYAWPTDGTKELIWPADT